MGISFVVKKLKEKQTAIGVVVAVLGTISFALVSTIVKGLLEDEQLDALIVLFYRLSFTCLDTTPVIKIQNLKFFPELFWNKKWTVLLQSISRATSIFLFYLSLQFLPLAEAGTLFHSTSPLFSSILSTIFLKERFRYLDIVLFLLSTTGVILILHPPFLFNETILPEHDIPFEDRMIGSLAAVAGGFFAVCLFFFLTTFISYKVEFLGWRPFLHKTFIGS